MAPILAVFFSRGVGLTDWLQRGLLEREKMLYERHLADGSLSLVFFITYRTEDGKLAQRLVTEGRLDPRIVVIPAPVWVKNWSTTLLYSIFIPFLHWRPLRQADVYKTNQLDGSWAAALAAVFHNRPLIARSGYTISRLCIQRKRTAAACACYRVIERIAYATARFSTVSSVEDAAYVARVHGHRRCVRLVTNAVDVDVFAPLQVSERHERRIVFVGRLDPIKNIHALLDAAGMIGWGVDIIGDGPLRDSLVAHAISRGVDLCLLGLVPNCELPAILAHYRYFALVSHFEGMPKSLLEAMACGLCCIGTPVAGIREVLRDGFTGIVATSSDASAIAYALKRCESNNWNEIGMRARVYVEKRHAFPRVVSADARVLSEALGCKVPSSRADAQGASCRSPLVSVVMAVHNGAAYLEEALTSIYNQDYREFEVIIVDDGSTDETPGVIQRWTKQDSRIHVITQTNQGLTRSLNAALSRARGVYIARQDADDCSTQDRFAKQVAFLECHSDHSLVGSAYREIDGHGNFLGLQRHALVRGTMRLRKYLRRGNPFCHSSVMIRRSALIKVGGYDESFKYAQDYALWVKLVRHHSADNLPEVLVSRRIQSQMLTIRKRRSQRWHALRARMRALRWFSGPFVDWYWLMVDALKIIGPSVSYR